VKHIQLQSHRGAQHVENEGPYSTLSLNKNAPILASCSFNKHGLMMTIFSKQHQHTFTNDVPVQLFLSLHFCSLHFK